MSRLELLQARARAYGEYGKLVDAYINSGLDEAQARERSGTAPQGYDDTVRGEKPLCISICYTAIYKTALQAHYINGPQYDRLTSSLPDRHLQAYFHSNIAEILGALVNGPNIPVPPEPSLYWMWRRESEAEGFNPFGRPVAHAMFALDGGNPAGTNNALVTYGDGAPLLFAIHELDLALAWDAEANAWRQNSRDRLFVFIVRTPMSFLRAL